MKLKKLYIVLSAAVLMLLAAVSAAGAAVSSGAGGTGQPAADASSAIKIDLHHVLIQAQGSSALQVREVLKVNNTGKTPYTGTAKDKGDRPEVLRLSLPDGYVNLSVDGVSKDSVVTAQSGVVITSPLNPGITQVTLSYGMPLTAGQLEFNKSVNYPTDILYVLSPQGELNIRGDAGIKDYGIQNLDGKTFHVLLMDKALPGQKFNLRISPDRVGQGYQEPKSGFHSASHLQWWANSPMKNTNPHIWVAAVVLLVFGGIALGGYRLKRQREIRKQQEPDDRLAGMLDDLVIRQRRLLTRIDALDTRHEREEIEPEEYSALREQYKEKLVKIKLKIKELEALEEAGEYQTRTGELE